MLFVLCSILGAVSLFGQDLPYEREISAYEKAQIDDPCEPGGTVFVGSSTWARWGKRLEKDFESFQAINRGFGGSTIPDQLRAVDRIVLPLQPKRIVFFCGTNDIARNASPESVYENFVKFLEKTWEKDPKIEVFFVTATRAPIRKQFWEKVDAFNAKVKALAEKREKLHYLDLISPMNDENGVTREDLYISDRLHLNRAGEELWVEIITKALEDNETVIRDTSFTEGFIILGTKHGDESRIENFGKDGVKPNWKLAQWNSKGKLDKLEISGDIITLSDPYKYVKLDRKEGNIELFADTSKEYEKPRKSASEPWVHLLLEQSPFEKPIKLSECKEIWAELEFELTELEAFGEQAPGLHTAQVGWFLYVKNTNPESKGEHDFLWFGLSLFDARYDFTDLYAAQDFAMPDGKFIYTLGSKTLLKEKPVPGKRLNIRCDILPEIRKGVQAAHEKGFIKNSQVEDMIIDGMNLGWEIPGTYKAGIKFYRLEITSK